MGGASSLQYETKDLSGRVAIVTGSNSGVGYEAAKALARMGAKIIMACRSQTKAEQAITRMKEELPDATLDVEFAQLDLASLKSTASFAESFLANHSKLHILCCNAGYIAVKFEYTEDGYEKSFQTNYLGHFLLITRFVPLLKATGDGARIVSVSSAGHKGSKYNLANTNQPASFSTMYTYGNSKLLQIMMTGALIRRLSESGVGTTSLHPGVVNTQFGEDSMVFRAMKRVGSAVGAVRDCEQGARTTIKLCVEDLPTDGSQVYFADCRATSPAGIALNTNQQEAVFDYSVGLLKDYIHEEGAQILGVDLSTVTAPETGLPASPEEVATFNAAANPQPAATAAAASAEGDVPASEEDTPPAEATPAVTSDETTESATATPAAEEAPAASSEEAAETQEDQQQEGGEAKETE